jgi:hypothetical protein
VLRELAGLEDAHATLRARASRGATQVGEGPAVAAETISAAGAVAAAALAAFTAWRAERITAGVTRERQREQWRRVRGRPAREPSR